MISRTSSCAPRDEDAQYTWPPHPAAAAFPVLEGPEFEAFVEGIDHDGQLEPIVLYRDPEGRVWLLDGRNRDRALRRLGREPAVVEWTGECGSPTAFVMARNMQRRHLTPGQRAAIAARLLPSLREDARQRQRAAALRTNALRRASREGLPLPPEPEPPPVKGETREIAARLVGVSPRIISEAASVLAKAPDLLDEVIAGHITLPEARRRALAREAEAWPAGELPPPANEPPSHHEVDAAEATRLQEEVVRLLEQRRPSPEAREAALTRAQVVLAFLRRARADLRA